MDTREGAHAQRCQRLEIPHALWKCPTQRRAKHPPAHAAAAELHPRQRLPPTLPVNHCQLLLEARRSQPCALSRHEGAYGGAYGSMAAAAYVVPTHHTPAVRRQIETSHCRNIPFSEITHEAYMLHRTIRKALLTQTYGCTHLHTAWCRLVQ